MAQIQSSEHEDNSVPSTEAAPPRPRRSLKKCSQCRKNRKKCLPVDRVWPQVCERCKKSGYQCSPPLLKSQDGAEGYDSDGNNGQDALGEDVDNPEVPGQGRSTSSVGGSSKVEKRARPHKSLRRKRRQSDGESPKSKRQQAKKPRLEQDHTTSESSRGASVSQILLEIGYLYLADKEMARKKIEHVCYIKKEECVICNYLGSLKNKVESELAGQILYAKNIAESYIKKYSNNPSKESYTLDEAESIFAYLRDLVSGNGLNMESLYDKDSIMTHIKILKLHRNWPQAEILLERVARQIRSLQNNRSDPAIFQEYLECLNRTSLEVSRILDKFKPPGDHDAINYDFPIPALHRAIASGVLPPLDFLEIDTDQRDFLGRTPLIIAAFHGKPEWVSLLITSYEIEIDDMDYQGHRALEVACLRGHSTSFKHLMDNGADPNPKLIMYGATPLHAAVRGNNEDIVRRLVVEYKARIEQETVFDEKSPLNWAHQMGTHPIKTLLQNKVGHVTPPVLRGDDDTLWGDNFLEAKNEMQ